MRNLTVCLACEHLSTGGMPRYVLNSIRSLRQLGHRCCVYERTKTGVDALKRKIVSEVASYGSGKDLPTFCRENAVDIVGGHDWKWERPALPSFDTVHTVNPIGLHALKYVDTDLWVLLNPYQRGYFTGIPAVYLPTFVDTTEFYPAKFFAVRRQLRMKYGLPVDGALVLGVGVVTENKGYLDLVTRWDLPAHLVIAGPLADNFREDWSRVAAAARGKRVVLLGEQSAVCELFAACDVFVHPAKEECASLVTLEAAAMGLPLVLRRNQSTDVYFQQERNPLAFIAPSADALIAGVQAALERRVEVREMAQRAQAHVLRYHSPSVFQAGIAQVLQRLEPLKVSSATGVRHSRSRAMNCAVDYSEGARVVISGPAGYGYTVEFKDAETGRVSSRETVIDEQGLGLVVESRERYYVPWQITVACDRGQVTGFDLDLRGQYVLIHLEQTGLGDTLAWAPYVLEFQAKTGCRPVLVTDWPALLGPALPGVTVVAPSDSIPWCYAVYRLGVFDDPGRCKAGWRAIPLQQVATDILGLPYKERHLDLRGLAGANPFSKPYIAFAHRSTLRAKEWTFPDGWQRVIDAIRALGYLAVPVSYEGCALRGVELPGPRDIVAGALTRIAHSRLFIGGPSGLSWLAAAVQTPVVMISGFSLAFTEFTRGLTRVQNTSVCHGCYNDGGLPFDRWNFDWCPRNNKFVCTAAISPDAVIAAVKQVLDG